MLIFPDLKFLQNLILTQLSKIYFHCQVQRLISKQLPTHSPKADNSKRFPTFHENQTHKRAAHCTATIENWYGGCAVVGIVGGLRS
jgi:hypothetical protein